VVPGASRPLPYHPGVDSPEKIAELAAGTLCARALDEDLKRRVSRYHPAGRLYRTADDLEQVLTALADMNHLIVRRT